MREAPPGRPLADTHEVSLLERGLYHPDGQILEEVYEYASFLQSRMHAAGVRCSDCHDPHSLRLRASGNGTCTTCHAAAVFSTAAPTIFTAPGRTARAAWTATCRDDSTWSWTGGATTVSGRPGPT